MKQVPFFNTKNPDWFDNEKIKLTASDLCSACGVVYLGVYRKDYTEPRSYRTFFRKRVIEYTEKISADFNIAIADDTPLENIKLLQIAIKGWLIGNNFHKRRNYTV